MILHLIPISILSFLSIFACLSTSIPDETELYANCSKPFQCANIENISYPFWGGERSQNCGHPNFYLNCENKDFPQIKIQSFTYRVLSIDSSSKSFTLIQSDFWDSVCPSILINATLSLPYLEYSSSSDNITLYYGCSPSNSSFPNEFDCDIDGLDKTSYYSTQYGLPNIFAFLKFVSCSTSVLVQVSRSSAEALSSITPLMNISMAVQSGFGMDWHVNNEDCGMCARSGGVCGSDPSSEAFSFVCFCSDKAYNVSCGDGGNGRKTNSKRVDRALFISGAVCGSLMVAFAIFVIYVCRKRRKNRFVSRSIEIGNVKIEEIPISHQSKSLTTTSTTTTSSTSFSQGTTSFPSITSDSGTPSSYFGVKVFNYAELEEATDNFNSSREIGDGGFGTVFYGKLDDGREVAVKRLYENNFRRVTQFMNEVEILTRLSHANLVKLYGCTSRQSRELLLVYEYIPNGTISDHLHGSRAKSSLLTWPMRLNIAIETAEALVYLHKSEIIHRDIKTTNILLDNDFRVKVADFGISRLFPNNVTHVSTNPQGTPGYVDPEYHMCYHLTEKSDVYSFGVVLVELISSKQAVDITRDRHDINLSNMAVNKIQNGKLHELVDLSLGFGENSSIERMIKSVAELAFRCLQIERDLRPSMEELLEGLKRIRNNENTTKLDVTDDEIALLKNNSPPFSPNSVVENKWISNDTSRTTNISG